MSRPPRADAQTLRIARKALLRSIANDKRKYPNLREMEKATGLARATISWMMDESNCKTVRLASKTLKKLSTSLGLSEQTRRLASEYRSLMASAKTTNVPASAPQAKAAASAVWDSCHANDAKSEWPIMGREAA